MARTFCREQDLQADVLRASLADFYAAPGDYVAFAEKNHKPEYWSQVRDSIERVLARAARCRVLEFGAGFSGFADYISDVRARVVLHVQDVTAANEAHLRSVADEVHVKDLLQVRGQYDVIFSTFVWEHLTRPAGTLRHLLGLLAPSGELLIASPRYDFPLYISPSARHLTRARRAAIALYILARRAWTLVARRPAFLLHASPGIAHGCSHIDADAVHWVSLWDLRAALPPGWSAERLRIPASGLRGRFWEKYLLMFVRVRATRR